MPTLDFTLGLRMDRCFANMFHVLAFAVSMDKLNGFIGRDALVEYRKNGAPKKRIVQFVLSDPDAQLWGVNWFFEMVARSVKFALLRTVTR